MHESLQFRYYVLASLHFRCRLPTPCGVEQWAITLSLKDGCFWANLLSVLGNPLPFPLNIDLETLTESLGSSPFAQSSLARMDWLPSLTWRYSEFG